MHVEAWGLNHSLYLPYVMHGRPSVAASFSLRPQDSLWDGAHDARLTGDVVDEILGGKVDRADWSVAPDDHRTGARPRHKPSLPYRAFPLVKLHRCSRTTRPGSNPAKLAATVARARSLHAARGGSCAGRRQQLHACSALLQQQQHFPAGASSCPTRRPRARA